MTLPKFPFTVKKGNSIVKIYHVGLKDDYQEYKVAYYQHGKRKIETFADFKKARNRADEINDSVNTGNAHTLTLTGEDRHAFTRATEALKPLKIPLDMAVLQFVELHKILGDASPIEAAREYVRRHAVKLTSKTVTEAVDEFVKSKTSDGKSKRYVEDLDYRLGKLKASFQCALASIAEPELRAFLDKLGLSPRSRNNFRSTLISFFAWAKKKKYLSADWNELSSIETVKDNTGDIEIFTADELVSLLTHADKKLVPFLTIAAFAGLRSAEVDRLDWREVKFQSGFIEVAKSKAKTRSRRLTPISDNLKAWLQPYAKTTGKVWPHGHAYLYEMLQETATAAKVPWKPNALRHSFISYRVAETQDVNKTALEAGNSPAMIFSNYRELVTPDDATRWFSIKPDESAGGKITFLKATPA